MNSFRVQKGEFVSLMQSQKELVKFDVVDVVSDTVSEYFLIIYLQKKIVSKST